MCINSMIPYKRVTSSCEFFVCLSVRLSDFMFEKTTDQIGLGDGSMDTLSKVIGDSTLARILKIK